jgi:hypothetical protein
MATLGADADDDQMRALTGFELTVNAGATDFVTAERLLEPVTPDAEAHGDDGAGSCQ